MATAQFYLSQQPAQPQQQSLINNIEHKPILAERFKTKPCQNFDRTGFCPYEARCMFAHGEHDLRTADMNVADKLVTEDAIKAWQRAKMIADRLAARKRAKKAAKKEAERANKAALAASTTSSGSVAKPAVVASSEGDSSEEQPQLATPDTIPSAKSPRVETSAVIVNLLTKLGNTAAPTAAAPAQVAPASTPARRYRHNPYAAVPLVPAVCEVPRASMDLPAPRYAATTAAAQQYLGHQPYVTMDVPTTTAYATSMSSSSLCFCAHCLSATQQHVLPMPPMRCAPSLASVAPHGGVNTILLA